MNEFGDYCLLLSLVLAIYGMVAALWGAASRQHRIVRSAERAALATCAAVTLATGIMLYLLLTDDFSVSHVMDSSSRTLPFFYKISALWGAHDGSMLFWVFVTALCSGVVIYQNRHRRRDMMPYVVAVLMLNLAFFLALNLFHSNPFDQLMQVAADGSVRKLAAADGRGLNPLLQYWAMVIHPPILYLGFIGFVVPFAFTTAALITRQPGDTWIGAARRWTLLTWLLLGVGLMLGAKWAYVVLGWGGYWGWDPVENSSLMPWLIGTAYLHSVIIQERKGMMKVWNALLVMLCYILGVFGTFITRSGIVSSVHAFADSSLGKYFLVYMALVIAGFLVLVASRLPYLKSQRSLDSLLSRESAFLWNNLILVVCCLAVFWGTMLPVFSEWIQGTKITVGPPFFNRVSVPIGMFLLLLTGVGPVFAWRKTSVESLKRSFLWPGMLAVATCLALLAAGMRNVYTVICFTLCMFVTATIFEEFIKAAYLRVKSQGESFPFALFRLTLRNRRRYGGYLVHFGVALLFIGLAGNAFNREITQTMAPGDVLKIGDYSIQFTRFEEGETPSYVYGVALLDAYKDGRFLRTLKPEKRIYQRGEGQSTTTVALRSSLKEDLYTVFNGIANDGRTYEITAHVNPLVFWLWFGSVVMFFGTLITLLPERKGALAPPQTAPARAGILEES
jgi:cytochrome c-type biogenesis protein CcmF